MSVQVRSVESSDDPFLFQIFCSSRPELAFLPEPLLQMQFRAQAMSYKSQYPGAEHRLILMEGRPSGRILVDRSGERLHLVDIALLPEARGRGIGTALLHALQAEAGVAGLPVRLSVYEANPARRLYERLGFRVTGNQPPYLMMEWLAQ